MTIIPEAISDERPENLAMDFERLRQLGIQYIQELAGEFWTDYNDHDPGITVLEQLCYALTDLAYRTDFEVQDHLAGKKNEEKPFFLPPIILPCRPLTKLDYRKMLIDAVPNLRNAWFEPTSSQEHSLVGLYKIFLDLEDAVEDSQAISQLVKEVYVQNRNLGEDFDQIIVLESVYITLYADIEIESADLLEQTLAQIYYQLNAFLNPEIKFYSLSELQKEGKPLKEIFEGPLLKHGFIKNEDLLPKPDSLPISEVIKIIMQVPGVVSAKNLYLKVGEKIYENQFNIATHQKPRLVLSNQAKTGNQNFTINFYKGNAHYDQIDPILYRRYLNELEAAQKRVYRVQEDFTQIPEGRLLQIEEYFSIQNQFPIIYGVGEEGIPNRPSERRKAQAKQLKGYLMLFEQLLVNYLAQLAHIKELFSPNTESQKSYFAKTLEEVPQAQHFFYADTQDLTQDVLLKTALPRDYSQGLALLTAQQDNFGNRRNRFLDFLLAIHGETYLQYSASQKNFYFDQETFQYFAIRNKTLFFQYLPLIGQARNKAFNYQEDPQAAGNLSGLEIKLSTLLGFNIHNLDPTHETAYHLAKTSTLHVFEQEKLRLFEPADAPSLANWTENTSLALQKLSEDIIKENFDFLDEEDIKQTEHHPEEDKLKEKINFYKKIPGLPTYFLRKGLHWKNYRLGQISTAQDDSPWQLVFLENTQETWHLLGTFETETEALQAVKLIWKNLRNYNVASEGLHLFEHILLRPSVEEKKFGVFLIDAEGKPVLRSTEKYDFQTRSEVVKHIAPYLFTYENYSVEQRKDGNFEILFQDVDKSTQFVSLRYYESVQEIHEKMEDIFNFLADKTSLTPFKGKIKFFIQTDDDNPPIPEDFFSNMISILLPNWTIRFHNEEFRSVVEHLILENKPANLSAQVHWLNLDSMQSFEKLYQTWTNTKQTENQENKTQLSQLNQELTKFLLALIE